MRTGWLSWVRANDKTIIDMLENQGRITHKLFTITSQTFVTTLDREDISRLTTSKTKL
jgi:hypothetical protein